MAVAAHERLAVAVLGHPSLVEHHDLVDEVERRQPVGDDERRTPDHQLGDGRRDALLGAGIDARGGLVQHHQVGLAEPHASEGEELGLPGGQPGTRRAERAVDAAGGERPSPTAPSAATTASSLGAGS